MKADLQGDGHIALQILTVSKPLAGIELMETLADLLAQSSVLHRHLCPRQVLGVRMGLLAAELLSLDLPQTDKRLLTIVETDGCFTTGLSVATNCWVGRRTLRVEDYGKVAATFVDTAPAKRCALCRGRLFVRLRTVTRPKPVTNGRHN